MTDNNDSFKEELIDPSEDSKTGLGIALFGVFLIGIGVAISLMPRGGPWVGLAFALLGSWLIWKSIGHRSDVKADRRSGTAELSGTVSERHEQTTESYGEYGSASTTSHYIRVRNRKFGISQALYHWIGRGDEVVVSFYPRTQTLVEVTRTKRGPPEPVKEVPAQDPADTVTGKICQALRDIGVAASVSASDMYGGGEIKIAVGPIREVNVRAVDPWDNLHQIECVVPDSRIGRDVPLIHAHSVRARSFFGKVVGVRWDAPLNEVSNRRGGFAQSVADRLNSDQAVTKSIEQAGFDVVVETDPAAYRGGWLLQRAAGHGNVDDEMSESKATRWTRAGWDCYEAIAEVLLAMPMPAEEAS